jgi:hypothetical protein
MSSNIWTAQTEGIALNEDLVDYSVEGKDGTIGKVDHVNYAGTCITVTTGGLLKKTKHVIPARAIQEINLDEQSVHVALTTDEVSASPEYDEQLGIDENCEAKVEEYYGGILSR